MNPPNALVRTLNWNEISCLARLYAESKKPFNYKTYHTNDRTLWEFNVEPISDDCFRLVTVQRKYGDVKIRHEELYNLSDFRILPTTKSKL